MAADKRQWRSKAKCSLSRPLYDNAIPYKPRGVGCQEAEVRELEGKSVGLSVEWSHGSRTAAWNELWGRIFREILPDARRDRRED
jgi:hypothetical protein